MYAHNHLCLYWDFDWRHVDVETSSSSVCVRVSVAFPLHILAIFFVFVFVLMIINRFWWFYKWVSEYWLLPLSLLMLLVLLLREGGTFESSFLMRKYYNSRIYLINFCFTLLVRSRIYRAFEKKYILTVKFLIGLFSSLSCVHFSLKLIDKSHKWFSHKIK